MSGVQTIEVAAGEDGMRLDRWFKAHYPGLGHGALQRLLRTGQVRLDGGRVKANARVEAGQMVRVPPLDQGAETTSKKPKPKVSEQDSEFIRSAVLHRDDRVIVLNKPPGLATQGGSKTDRHVDGMLDALRFEGQERPRLVHRLDRDTSGVLLLARDRKAAQVLAKSFQARATQKIYWALVAGVPRPERGRIDMALVKVGVAGDQRMAPADRRDPDAQRAESVYAVVDRAGNRVSWLAVSPLTGRTHQLRVHLAETGHPVIGDGKYGGEHPDAETGLERKLHLHARTLNIAHPNGGLLSVTAPLPEHIRKAWEFLGFSEADGEPDPLFSEEQV